VTDRRMTSQAWGGGEFALRLVPRQRAAPPYWRTRTHTHTHTQFSTFHTPKSASMDQPAQELYNSEFPALAYSVTRFRWAVYGFNSGHFMSTIKARNLPFSIVLACDPYAHGHPLFNEVAKCQNVLHGASALLDNIRPSGNASPIDR
jgi:hypothetical protein